MNHDRILDIDAPGDEPLNLAMEDGGAVTVQTESIRWTPPSICDLEEELEQCTPSNKELKERAARHQPPQEWWDDETDPFSA